MLDLLLRVGLAVQLDDHGRLAGVAHAADDRAVRRRLRAGLGRGEARVGDFLFRGIGGNRRPLLIADGDGFGILRRLHAVEVDVQAVIARRQAGKAHAVAALLDRLVLHLRLRISLAVQLDDHGRLAGVVHAAADRAVCRRCRAGLGCSEARVDVDRRHVRPAVLLLLIGASCAAAGVAVCAAAGVAVRAAASVAVCAAAGVAVRAAALVLNAADRHRDLLLRRQLALTPEVEAQRIAARSKLGELEAAALAQLPVVDLRAILIQLDDHFGAAELHAAADRAVRGRIRAGVRVAGGRADKHIALFASLIGKRRRDVFLFLFVPLRVFGHDQHRLRLAGRRLPLCQRGKGHAAAEHRQRQCCRDLSLHVISLHGNPLRASFSNRFASSYHVLFDYATAARFMIFLVT